MVGPGNHNHQHLRPRQISLHCLFLSLTYIRTSIYTYTVRQHVTLSIDEDIYREMKIQAVREDRDVSSITEDLYREYLKRLKAKPKK